ncbi:MAG: carbon monoxide dehydrogenase subunit G [Gemmatimonadota bacterium]|nr:carbon monoxide dehydrogenase subunit G [Gemmatimonadota bacterium]
MRFEVTGAEEIAAPIAQVWTRLLDHEYVASCAPNVESVEAADETHFTVVTALGVGSIRLRFTLRVALEDLAAPTFARMRVSGDAPGSAARAEASATLTETAPGATQLDWVLAADVHGTIAGVGARLLKGTARKLTARFWKAFADGVVPGAAPPKGKRAKARTRARKPA